MNTIDQYNRERWEHYHLINDAHPNGIACPECGKELWDSAPNFSLTSNPPQKHVHCPNCGWIGTVLA